MKIAWLSQLNLEADLADVMRGGAPKHFIVVDFHIREALLKERQQDTSRSLNSP